jgi:acetyl esterase/lipase
VASRDSSEILTDPPPPAADERVVYGSEPLQFGDLRLPAGEGPFPLAVVLHGGYWKATYNLIHMGHMCIALTGAGVASWNVEYRRVGDVGGGWPGTADDVARATAFVEELAEHSPLDLSRVAIVGHSAGGHLGLWAAKRAGLPVAAIAPVSDLADSARQAGPDGPAARFLGGLPDEVPERYAAASPRELLPLGTRQVVVHGTADETVPFEMSEAYVAAARAEAELVTLVGAGHFEPVDPQAHEWPATLAAVRGLLGLS